MVAGEQTLAGMEIDTLSINTIRTLAIDASAEGKFRTSGRAHGAGSGGLRRCGSNFLRYDPEGSDLAKPRPLRAFERPRVHAAVLRLLYLAECAR